MKVFIAGYPGNMGGANTEAFHTAKLWRGGGIEVEWIPTWGSDDEQRKRLEAIGCPTHHVRPEELHAVPGLAGSIVVSFCNSRFVAEAHRFRALGCPVVWSNCMTFLFEHEVHHFNRYGLFEAFHFQSCFQQQELATAMTRWGFTADDPRGHMIRGAFDFDMFAYRPLDHRPGEEFVFGRMARPDDDKWSSNTWPIYSAVPYARKRARVLGCNPTTLRKIGQPPSWAEALPPQAMPVPEYLAGLHALVPINGGARENWPRAGLEAMAAGVPIVAQNQWGWREMVDHGRTGYLADNDQEFAYYVAHLAHNPPLRLNMAYAARKHVERLADPHTLYARWKQLFVELEADGSTFGEHEAIEGMA